MKPLKTSTHPQLKHCTCTCHTMKEFGTIFYHCAVCRHDHPLKPSKEFEAGKLEGKREVVEEIRIWAKKRNNDADLVATSDLMRYLEKLEGRGNEKTIY